MTALAEDFLLLDAAQVGRAAVAVALYDANSVHADATNPSLLPAIDELVASGRFQYLQTARPIGLGLMADKAALQDHVVGMLNAVREDREAAMRLVNIVATNGHLLEAMTKVWAQVGVAHHSGPRLQEEPMAWLSAWPVDLADLRLASERGVVAAAMISSAATTRDTLSPEHARELTKLWLEGSTSALVLVASLWPEQVTEDVVPAALRVDIEQARAQQERWNAIVREELHEADCA